MSKILNKVAESFEFFEVEPIDIIETAPTVKEASEEFVFFGGEPEKDEEIILDDEPDDMDPMRNNETSMQYHSRLNGWKQSDFI